MNQTEAAEVKEHNLAVLYKDSIVQFPLNMVLYTALRSRLITLICAELYKS